MLKTVSTNSVIFLATFEFDFLCEALRGREKSAFRKFIKISKLESNHKTVNFWKTDLTIDIYMVQSTLNAKIFSYQPWVIEWITICCYYWQNHLKRKNPLTSVVADLRRLYSNWLNFGQKSNESWNFIFVINYSCAI